MATWLTDDAEEAEEAAAEDERCLAVAVPGRASFSLFLVVVWLDSVAVSSSTVVLSEGDFLWSLGLGAGLVLARPKKDRRRDTLCFTSSCARSSIFSCHKSWMEYTSVLSS